MTKQDFEKRLGALNERIERIGASFEHSFYDENHLNCFWYDGNDIATVEYKGYSISFDVCGDVSIGVSTDRESDLCFRHRDGGEPFYDNLECRGVIADDNVLYNLIDLCGITFENNNWVNIVITCLATGEYVSEPEAVDESNILEAVENNLDSYVEYIDRLVENAE